MTRRKLSVPDIILLCVTCVLIGCALLILGWYGTTFLTTSQKSSIIAQKVDVSTANARCTLEIPGGTLSIKRPQQAAVRSAYHLETEVHLDQAMRFTNCEGNLPNWNLNLEAQTTLVGAEVEPFAVIRQPASSRQDFQYNWTFTPDEAIDTYQSHLWLRVIVTEQDQTVERWDMLVRDFPMRNVLLFGQPTILWLITAGVSAMIGLLTLILFIQRQKKARA